MAKGRRAWLPLHARPRPAYRTHWHDAIFARAGRPSVVARSEIDLETKLMSCPGACIRRRRGHQREMAATQRCYCCLIRFFVCTLHHDVARRSARQTDRHRWRHKLLVEVIAIRNYKQKAKLFSIVIKHE